MSKRAVVPCGVFYALLFAGVIGFVPSPTNISVVCHNFVNVLYWNYSNPSEQLKFSVRVEAYESDSQTVPDTTRTYLDISSYSRDVSDDYLVYVTAHDGQEKSESVSIRFTYSKDFFDEKKHKCSLDFPAVNTSVHKDVIEASFQHPFFLHELNILNEEFMYTVTHDEQKVSYFCFEEEELCTAEIHLNQSTAGQCVELKFEGKIAGIPSYTYRNVCVPQQMPVTDRTGLIAAVLGGGTVMLFIIIGFVWLLCRKLSKIPKIPEFLRNVIPGQAPTTQPEPNAISAMTPQGHTPLLTAETSSYGSPPISPNEKECKENTILEETVVHLPEVSEEDVNCDDSGGFCWSSDYDSPKFLQEMSPGDITEGYGPRPPVL
ncbi:growth/differentiation factor 10b [Sinocyclocheilus grahami]|uniref:Fibronectin type-III domain-containing protein n=1 Tax=Sinocyclocheilus grahami TaxID=75366 RepID=A0A672MA29_SINGR|nr:PREDICTED: interferon gamma receptor 1-like [Sinocyclocheilus grahami]